ncbi:MAG: hypothetical protein JST66_03765, partial [Bacteroidetes bacterium]|nr:hypothetical protein [Bacteroidota bacterium]
MNCRNASARPTRRTSWWRHAAAAAALVLFGTANAQNVTVTGATAGGNGSYATLGAAFTAINAVAHPGEAIVVTIDANTTETGSAVLNGNTWNSLAIHPSVAGVSISGASVGGRGLIELNGADNVTLDGAVGGVGSSRDLTITNTATNTTTYTSVVRLAVLASTQTSADGNIIRNCVLNGSATGRNGSANTSTNGSENTTFGIYAGGKGAPGGTAPAAISSVTSDSAPSGTTINNLSVANNAINACARGVVFNGAAASVSAGTLSITDNTIGASATLGSYPFTTPTTSVYTKGILISGANTLTITGNTIQNILSYVGTGMTAIELNSAITGVTTTISNNIISGVAQNSTAGNSAIGILFSAHSGGTYNISGNSISNLQNNGNASNAAISIVTSSATAGTIQRNNISTVYARSTGGYSAAGILIGSSAGNNITIQNNFVRDINMCPNNSNVTIAFGAVGIRLNGGTGHKVLHNTVSLAGPVFTSTSTDITACLSITATSMTGMDVRNNIFSNTMSGGSSTTPHMCIQLIAGGTSAMNLLMNNNALYQGSGAMNSILGTTTPTYYTAANFNAGATTPATNMRAYTSTLSPAGTNDDASKASTAAAPFISATNLHVDITSPQAVNLNSAGASGTGVTTDIDGDARSTPPDIGADEFVLPLCTTANGGAISPGTASVCSGGTYTMTSTGAEIGLGISYQWEVSTVGGGSGFSLASGGSGATTTT